jgi:hypothetical protein
MIHMRFHLRAKDVKGYMVIILWCNFPGTLARGTEALGGTAACMKTQPPKQSWRGNTQSQSRPLATVDVHQAAILSWMEDIAPFGIFTTDIHLRVQSWNEWLETHSGLAAPQVIGRPLVELFPDLCKRKMDEHFRRALAGEIIVLSAALSRVFAPVSA